MSHDLQNYFDVVMDLSKECGKVIKNALKKAKNIEMKSSDVDFVTETDRQVEQMLTSGLLAHFPSHKFIGEETVSGGGKCELTDAPTWIIDPIDGTMNFVHTNPNVCISIALVINHKTEIGIIYNPILDLMFTARAGQGAFLNGETIRVSGQEDLSKALLSCEIGTCRRKDKLDAVMANLERLVSQVHGVRSLGSAALNMAMVAYGGVDMYYETGIHVWDIAAGDIMIREAGGCVIDIEGGPFDLMSRRVLCAASKPLADKLVSVMKPIPHEPRD